MPDADTTAAARASALLDLGRPGQAEQLARMALRADPEDDALLVVLTRALLEQGNDAEAAAVAGRVLAADPDNVMGLSCAAVAAVRLGKPAEALPVLQRAVQLAPLWADLHRQYAEVLAVNERRSLAIEAARRARELDPQSPTIAAVLGHMLLAARQYDEARAEVDRALRLDPESVRAHQAAAQWELLRGGTNRSVTHYRAALQLDPTNQVARVALVTALKSRNRVYRGLVRFHLWLRTLSPGQRRAATLGPLAGLIVTLRVLVALDASGPGMALVGLGVLVLTLAWLIDAVGGVILLASRTDRVLLAEQQRRSALAFAVSLSLALGCLVGAVWVDALGPYGFSFGVWAVTATIAGRIRRLPYWRLLRGAAVLAAAVGTGGLVLLALGLHDASFAASTVLATEAVVSLLIAILAR